MKIKTRIMIMSLAFLFVSVPMALEPVSAATVYVQNASYYTGTSSLSEQIQSVLDNASSGDTINFLGNLYDGLQLVINKKLNIITNVGTKISASGSSKSVVFLINGPGASGTIINGFNIETNLGTGIFVNNTKNVTVSNNQITATKGSAIRIDKSYNGDIENNSITGSYTGINVSSSKYTNINGNNVTGSNQNGITVKNSVNTFINQDKISNNNADGINISNSNGTTVNGTTLEKNKGNGVEVHQSSQTLINGTTIKNNGKNGVSLTNSNKVKITNSQVIFNCNGISAENVSDMAIRSNYIGNNTCDGILLSGYANIVTISGNTLKGNANGIKLDCAGQKLTIEGNLITENMGRDKDTYPSANGPSGNGISFGYNYKHDAKNSIKHNAIYGNDRKNIDAEKAEKYSITNPIKIGSNWYGTNSIGSALLCCKMKSAATQMVLMRTGENTYSVYFIDGDTGNIETDLPSLSIKFRLDGVSSSEQYFQTVNGVATAQYEYAAVRNNVWASFEPESVYVAVNDAIRSITSGKDSTGDSCSNWDGYWGGPGSGSEGNDPGSGSGNNPGSATSSGSSGSSRGHGSSSGLTSTAGASAASSSAGSTGSSTQGGSTGEGDSKTAQELLVNDMKGPQIWGILGVIVLVILIVVAYYRKDLMNIIQKTRK
jgi:hypothetical protein